MWSCTLKDSVETTFILFTAVSKKNDQLERDEFDEEVYIIQAIAKWLSTKNNN